MTKCHFLPNLTDTKTGGQNGMNKGKRLTYNNTLHRQAIGTTVSWNNQLTAFPSYYWLQVQRIYDFEEHWLYICYFSIPSSFVRSLVRLNCRVLCHGNNVRVTGSFLLSSCIHNILIVYTRLLTRFEKLLSTWNTKTRYHSWLTNPSKHFSVHFF